MYTKIVKKTLIIKIVIIFILSIYHYNSFCNNKKIEQYDNPKKYYFYEKYHENYCKNFKKFQLTKASKRIDQDLCSFENQNSLSEIQISNDFINFKNSYLTNYKKLIFKQLRYQFKNKLDIYNFGLGYRKKHYDQWIIGNNIFYDILSPLSKANKKKFLSIGSEFLKDFTHITINTYHNVLDNNLCNIHNKKYFPVAYDIYIQNNLPFFTNIYTKINIEYHLNNKHNKIISNKKNNITKYYSNNIYKIILGLTYVPTQILTFNIDKIFFNSLKKYEIQFNIVTNYRISIPWIYQTMEKKDNNQNYIQKKQLSSINDKYIINRNHSMILDLFLDVDPNIIKKNNTTQHKQHKTIIKNTSKKNSYKKNHHYFYTHNKNKNNTISYMKYHYNITKEKFLNNSKIFPNKKLHADLELTLQTETSSNNTTIAHYIQTEKNNTNTDNTINNQDPHNQTTELINIDKCDLYPSQKKPQNKSLNLKIVQNNSTKTSIDCTNIPPPPPMSNINLKNYSLQTKNKTDFGTNIVNDDKNRENFKTNIIIEQHKKNNFSTLGSDTHLLKLHDILKKRKKTISTGSNDSNDSESIKLLKIIERQSMLSKNNDTDDDNTDSEESNNNFSE